MSPASSPGGTCSNPARSRRSARLPASRSSTSSATSAWTPSPGPDLARPSPVSISLAKASARRANSQPRPASTRSSSSPMSTRPPRPWKGAHSTSSTPAGAHLSGCPTSPAGPRSSSPCSSRRHVLSARGTPLRPRLRRRGGERFGRPLPLLPRPRARPLGRPRHLRRPDRGDHRERDLRVAPHPRLDRHRPRPGRPRHRVPARVRPPLLGGLQMDGPGGGARHLGAAGPPRGHPPDVLHPRAQGRRRGRRTEDAP